MEEPTGPRRAKVQKGPEGSGQVQWEDGEAEELSRIRTSSSQKIKQTIVSQAKAFNMFQENVSVDDEKTVFLGVTKTRIYLPIYVLSVFALVLYYALTPQTKKVDSDPNPSYDDYVSFQSFNPLCTCGRTALLQDAAHFNGPAPANFSLNACRTILKLATLCGAQLYSNCSLSTPGMLLAYSVLPTASSWCNDVGTAQKAYVGGFLGTSLPPTLYTPAQLDNAISTLVVSRLQTFSTYLSSITTSARSMALSGVAQQVDLADGARATDPPGCNCNMFASGVLTPDQLKNQSNCQFIPGWDVRSNPDVSQTCSVARAALGLPLDLLAPLTYTEVLGFQPPFTYFNQTDYFNFSRDASTTYLLDVFSSYQLYFGDDKSFNTLAPGVLQIDFRKYYDVCAPTICTYTEKSTPSFISAATTALGVLSGASAVLRVVIGMLVEKVLCNKQRKYQGASRKAEISGASRPSWGAVRTPSVGASAPVVATNPLAQGNH